MAKKKTAVLDIPVSFGKVSPGVGTANLSVKFGRDKIELVRADEVFCGHRLTGAIVIGRKGDGAGQKTITDDIDQRINATFDCKRLAITPLGYSIGLTFSLEDVDIHELIDFREKEGRLMVEVVAELPSGDEAESEAEEEEPDDSDDEQETKPKRRKRETAGV